MKRVLAVVFVFLLFCAGFVPAVGAVTYDLKTDWSDTANPNGPWSFWQGSDLLPNQPDYFSDGSMWEGFAKAAYGPGNPIGHVPVWVQVDAPWSDTNFSVGDIAFHTYSHTSSDPNNVPGYVLWKSPLEGTITISGNVWWGGWDDPNHYRGMNWGLFFNDGLLASGTAKETDKYPDDIDYFTGGGVMNVHVGDRVTFVGDYSGYDFPWSVGVNLTIEVTQRVPEPATMLLLGSGLLGLAPFRRRGAK